MKPSARSLSLLAPTLLLALGATGVGFAEGSSQAMGSTAFHIGIKLVRSCEMRTSGETSINCTRPVPHRLSGDTRPAPPQLDALTPPSPQRARPDGTSASAEPRFETFTF